MQNNTCSKQLDDAIELLTMVEQLLDGLNAAKSDGKRIPFRGMRLSVSQAKRLVLRAQESLTPEAEPPQSKDRAPGLALAGRVTLAPTLSGSSNPAGPRLKGRVRELRGALESLETFGSHGTPAGPGSPSPRSEN